MTAISFHLPAVLRSAIDEAVRDLHARVPAALGCVIATVDGRLVSYVVDNAADPQRVAAMIGSMVALGESIGRETQIGRSQYVVVNAHDGLFFAQRVPGKKELFVVSTLARSTASLGMILHETRTAATQIGRAVDEWLQRQQPATTES